MTSSFSRGYSDNATGNSSFGVIAVDGKGGLGPRTTHLSSQKVDCWINGGDFLSYHIRDNLSMSYSNNDRSSYLLAPIRGDQFSTGGEVIGGTFPMYNHFYSQKVYFSKHRHYGSFGNIGVIIQHYPWYHD